MQSPASKVARGAGHHNYISSGWEWGVQVPISSAPPHRRNLPCVHDRDPVAPIEIIISPFLIHTPWRTDAEEVRASQKLHRPWVKTQVNSEKPGSRRQTVGTFGTLGLNSCRSRFNAPPRSDPLSESEITWAWVSCKAPPDEDAIYNKIK